MTTTGEVDARPLITVAIPSLDQGRFLEAALASVFGQDLPVEVFVADGGSRDESLAVIERWSTRLAGWRSRPDAGQAAAINEAIAKGSAPFVCWLNSDDYLFPGGFRILCDALLTNPAAPAAYGMVWNDRDGRLDSVQVEPFDERRLARRCIISQPGTLIRRSAWEAVGGLREGLQMAMDYDLWWRLYRAFGPLLHVSAPVAVNREHPCTKTNRHRRLHYREAMAVVRAHHGRVPLRWWLAQPYSVWWRGLRGRLCRIKEDYFNDKKREDGAGP